MKKRKIRRPFGIGIVLVSIILLGLFTYGLFLSKIDSIELNENVETTIGKVVKTYRIRSRGYFVVYQFLVDGKVYEDHQPTSEEIKNGLCYIVRYSSKSPENCEIILSQVVPCK